MSEREAAVHKETTVFIISNAIIPIQMWIPEPIVIRLSIDDDFYFCA